MYLLPSAPLSPKALTHKCAHTHTHTHQHPGVVAHTPLSPEIRRQRWADLKVWGQPALPSGFQDSQDYLENPCLKQANGEKK